MPAAPARTESTIRRVTWGALLAGHPMRAPQWQNRVMMTFFVISAVNVESD